MRFAGRQVKTRKLDLADDEGDVAHPGDFDRVADRVRNVGKQARHFPRRFHPRLPWDRRARRQSPDGRVGPYGREQAVRFPAALADEKRAVGRGARQTALPRELEQAAVRIPAETRQFDVRRFLRVFASLR